MPFFDDKLVGMYVYIIYSHQSDKFYVGQTQDLLIRLDQHRSHYYTSNYTKVADDWTLYWSGICQSKSQALLIERHIKSMRSRKYYRSLRDYPELFKKLKQRYL